MVRTYVIPEDNQVSVVLSVPDEYIGKKVEVIAFQENEGEDLEDPRARPGNIARFIGALKLSDEERKQWDEYLKEVRNEWDR